MQRIIKRKFGMACLNISQGRFNNYSHKNLNAYDLCGMDSGIDRFRTFNDLEVIGVHEYSKTGFANTVCFYDKENDVTLALTHMNNLNGYYVGKKFKNGDTIYYEGTKGQATGNHIHMEIGKGKQPSKSKINGIWQLKDLINIEDYFYIDKSYTEERNNNGYKFSYTKEDEKMNKLIEGYQELKWLGSTVKVYLQKANQKIGMMSAKENGKENWQARQTIDKIDNDYIHYAKINCNFFNMNDGQHYGVEQSFDNDFAPKQEDWYCLYVDHEGMPEYCISSDYYYGKRDVKLACSPFAILRHNGVDVKKISKGANQSLETYNNNTLLLYMGNGQYAFMVTDNKLNSLQCLEFAKSYGAIGVYELDGGGSTQMIVDGYKKLYTGRAIANVLTFYTMPNQPSEPQDDGLKEENERLKNEINELTQAKESLMIENRNLNEELRMYDNKINRIKDIVSE